MSTALRDPANTHASSFAMWQSTKILLCTALAGGLIGIMALTWLAPDSLVAVPLALIVLLAVPIILKDELVLLCTIILAFALVSGYEAGFQVEEAVYGAVYLGYLAYWLLSRTFIFRKRFVLTKSDAALLLFLAYVTASIPLTFLFGGEPAAMVSEWLSISMIAFYFPIKEFVATDPRGPRALVATFGALTVVIAIRNLTEYVYELSHAEQLWQVSSGRAVVNEHMIMMAAIAGLTLYLFARTRFQRVLLFALVALFTLGIIFSLSRAVWLSYLAGVLVVYALVDYRRKLNIIVVGAAVVITVVTIGLSLYGDQLMLIGIGLVSRIFSLQSAISADISLINRLIEMDAAWEAIQLNPFIGYGLGVPYSYYSLVYETTRETTFVHNGYVGLVYRHGLIGAALMLTAFVGSTLRGVRLFRSERAMPVNRILGLIAAACLVAEALVANSANPFAVSDKMLIIGAACALAAGSDECERKRPIEAPKTGKPGGYLA